MVNHGNPQTINPKPNWFSGRTLVDGISQRILGNSEEIHVCSSCFCLYRRQAILWVNPPFYWQIHIIIIYIYIYIYTLI